MKKRPRSQIPRTMFTKRSAKAARFRSGQREAWRKVTWQEHDSYTVDGVDEVFDDPVEALHVAEERHALARRKSDGAALNYYMPTSELD